MTSRWLEPHEDRAWRAYRRLFTMLESRLARDLAEGSDLSMADYTVLSNLVEAEERRWRVSELADYMQWSPSRLSHQLTRMEKRGLVERQAVPDDGRGAMAVLTEAGYEAIRNATPGHMKAVRRHMIDLLDPDELEVLGDIAERVVEHLQAEEEQDAP